MIGDTAYGNIEAREQLEQRKVAVLAPVHSSSPMDGAIAKDEFQIDLEADTVTCPQGKTAPIYKPRQNRQSATRIARFKDCARCPLKRALRSDRHAR